MVARKDVAGNGVVDIADKNNIDTAESIGEEILQISMDKYIEKLMIERKERKLPCDKENVISHLIEEGYLKNQINESLQRLIDNGDITSRVLRNKVLFDVPGYDYIEKKTSGKSDPTNSYDSLVDELQSFKIYCHNSIIEMKSNLDSHLEKDGNNCDHVSTIKSKDVIIKLLNEEIVYLRNQNTNFQNALITHKHCNNVINVLRDELNKKHDIIDKLLNNNNNDNNHSSILNLQTKQQINSCEIDINQQKQQQLNLINLRSNDSNNLFVTHSRTVRYGLLSIKHQSVRSWNNLPAHLKTYTTYRHSKTAFSSELKQSYLDNYN